MTETGAFVGVAILIFLLSIAYEGLKYLREKMYVDAHKMEQLTQDKEGSTQNLRTQAKPIRQQFPRGSLAGSHETYEHNIPHGLSLASILLYCP